MKFKTKLKAAPVRTAQQLDQEYQFHALQVGHKGRLLRQLVKEIEDHEASLDALSLERLTLPPSPPAAPAPEKEAQNVNV